METNIAAYCGFAFLVVEVIGFYLVKKLYLSWDVRKHNERIKKKIEMIEGVSKKTYEPI